MSCTPTRCLPGLAVVILIGLLVENLVFDSLERVTVRRWGLYRRPALES